MQECRMQENERKTRGISSRNRQFQGSRVRSKCKRCNTSDTLPDCVGGNSCPRGNSVGELQMDYEDYYSDKLF